MSDLKSGSVDTKNQKNGFHHKDGRPKSLESLAPYRYDMKCMGMTYLMLSTVGPALTTNGND